ncbi:hypothetical protein OnM2_016070, partial [Erysiphe neolycopersici]
MPIYSKEDKLNLALQAIENSKKYREKPLSLRQAAKIFNVPHSTIS